MKKITFISIVLITIGFAQEKTFHLKSGDKITGQVVSETETTITVINPLMGEIIINKTDLQLPKVVVTLKSGDVVRGELVSRTGENVVVKSSFGELNINAENIASITDEEVVAQQVNQTQHGSVVQSVTKPVSDEWFFSKERLMDIWFDPTGFTLEKNKFYVSGLSWAFGLNEHVQISTNFFSYFWQDLNVRPKIMLFKKGNIDTQSAMSIGGHIHTQGLPAKYKWVEDAEQIINYVQNDTVYTGGYVRFGAEKDEFGVYDDWVGNGNKVWYEVFGAYTLSKLREGGNGRVNYTLGASAVIYPDEDLAPRVYGAVDIDITRSVKVMTEIFYDPFHVHPAELGSNKQIGTIHFDLGFLTNKIPLFGIASQSENFWVGWHFQPYFISFYWKL